MVEWALKNPFEAFLLALTAIWAIERVATRLPNRIMRHWNIHKHGYPPPHCDADGDFRDDEP